MISKIEKSRSDSFDPMVDRRRHGLTFPELIIVLILLFVLLSFLSPSVNRGLPGKRSQCKNNMKQLHLALQNYESTYHAFPPAYTVDDQGQPLHSWRTLILPFFGEQKLYDSIDLSKPWDDPANSAALNTAVHAYRCPSDDGPMNFTSYLAVVAPNSCFLATEARSLNAISEDQRKKTVMVVEVPTKQAVPWMKPFDADEQMVMKMGLKNIPQHADLNVVYVNGSVATFDHQMPDAKRRALISISASEK